MQHCRPLNRAIQNSQHVPKLPLFVELVLGVSYRVVVSVSDSRSRGGQFKTRWPEPLEIPGSITLTALRKDNPNVLSSVGGKRTITSVKVEE